LLRIMYTCMLTGKKKKNRKEEKKRQKPNTTLFPINFGVRITPHVLLRTSNTLELTKHATEVGR
jgi:hypothetical protein